MNRIYKVIWNKTRGMYMVVSELAKGQSKGGGRSVGRKKAVRTAAALAVFFSVVSMGGTSYAADPIQIGTVELNGQKVLTIEQGDASTIGATLGQVDTNKENIATNTKDIATNTASIAQHTLDITQETQERKAADTTLQTNIDSEASAREAADNALKQTMTDQKTSTALHVSKDGNLIVGTKENQIVNDLKINKKLTSGSISTGDITASGDVTVKGKRAADGVTDETTKDGTYIKQNNTVGNNLVSLDKQVTALDTRITDVKEYVLSETKTM